MNASQVFHLLVPEREGSPYPKRDIEPAQSVNRAENALINAASQKLARPDHFGQ
ncbi:hypothetical protein [uncultured Parasphingorhabdus sp.]|uniref:hypothetical protein n=1 Tax=uncultured Parasphingorhabdus sp. TaxID=2709694 RepID=UPI0030D8C9E1|tara:strand:+ start:11755 stop:11916 length:162 start_codon:yes stop_codon:yes gene_type:complete